MVETHVSVLLFSDDFVLKFKKAVRLPFVDFTTREARRLACQEELDANRRLSPDIYLGMAGVRLEAEVAAEQRAPNEAELVLDHAVVMRRLPADRSLAALTRVGDPELSRRLAGLARFLAAFHVRAARGPDIDDDARPGALGDTWRRCLHTLAPYAGRQVDAEVLAEVERLALEYLCGRAPLFEQRIAEGRVCDGHGDLLADDVFLLDDGPRVLDCLEFDVHLRHVDVMADVVFLAMDLERLGAPALAQGFLEAYQEAADDRFPVTLLHHYWAERAAVRAEVACLRAEQGATVPSSEPTAADALLSAALAHLEMGRVTLAVVSGLPGTGKTTLAHALGSRLGWPVLRSDEIRRELVDPGRPGPLTVAAAPAAYSAAVTERTYATLLERAGVALGLGQPVILDATFADRHMREAVEKLARRSANHLVVLRCGAPSAVTATRLRARMTEGTDVSGADEEIARAMAARGGDVPWPGAVELDTRSPLDELVDQALGFLGQSGRGDHSSVRAGERAGACGPSAL